MRKICQNSKYYVIKKIKKFTINKKNNEKRKKILDEH